MHAAVILTASSHSKRSELEKQHVDTFYGLLSVFQCSKLATLKKEWKEPGNEASR